MDWEATGNIWAAELHDLNYFENALFDCSFGKGTTELHGEAEIMAAIKITDVRDHGGIWSGQ